VGSGQDVVTLNEGGSTVTVQSVAVVVGSASNDRVNLGDAGNSLTISVVETLVGGAGQDWVNLSDAGNSLILAAIETLVGGAGQDWVSLGNRGNTMILAAVETLVGGSGGDWITLGNRGNTMVLAAIETLVGGTSGDEITLGNRGNTLILAAIETLIGGTGQDFVMLGNRGNTMLVSGVDIIVGGTNSDDVTVSSGHIQFDGRGGADRVLLQAGANNDLILFGSADDGSAAGQGFGFDQVVEFQSGIDQVVVLGSLRGLVDRNGNGALESANRAGGTVDLRTDELVRLATPVASLNDEGFAALRTALGSVATSGTAASALILANDGTNSGLYLISDNGDGQIAAGEVRMLSRFDYSMLSVGDFRLG